MRSPMVRVAASAALVVGLVAGTGIAVAQWNSSGEGGGDATAQRAISVTLDAGTGVADLYPGFAGGDVSVTLDNPNPYPVRFTSLTTGVVTSSNETACPATSVRVRAAEDIDLLVPAQVTDHPATIGDVVAMATSAPDGCQGATFTIQVTLGGAQA